MCLVAVALGCSARFPFVLASNRDEFFHRAAAPLAWWQPVPGATPILSGRDLSAGGTWLGITASGRLALVTNVREPGRVLTGAPSRGELVPRWLQGDQAGTLQDMALVPRNGYNFLAADLRSGNNGLWFSNRPQPRQQVLPAGLHGVSNAALDTPWPKLLRLKQRVGDALPHAQDLPALCSAAFTALADVQPAPDAELPTTGVPLERERQLSPAFIRIEAEAGVYGTRCSTLVVVERSAMGHTVHMTERRFSADGGVGGEAVFSFQLDSAA